MRANPVFKKKLNCEILFVKMNSAVYGKIPRKCMPDCSSQFTKEMTKTKTRIVHHFLEGRLSLCLRELAPRERTGRGDSTFPWHRAQVRDDSLLLLKAGQDAVD